MPKYVATAVRVAAVILPSASKNAPCTMSLSINWDNSSDTNDAITWCMLHLCSDRKRSKLLTCFFINKQALAMSVTRFRPGISIKRPDKSLEIRVARKVKCHSKSLKIPHQPFLDCASLCCDLFKFTYFAFPETDENTAEFTTN